MKQVKYFWRNRSNISQMFLAYNCGIDRQPSNWVADFFDKKKKVQMKMFTQNHLNWTISCSEFPSTFYRPLNSAKRFEPTKRDHPSILLASRQIASSRSINLPHKQYPPQAGQTSGLDPMLWSRSELKTGAVSEQKASETSNWKSKHPKISSWTVRTIIHRSS